MNNALKAMTMNSHLKIASVLVLSIGTLAVGFVAGNRGGEVNVFIPPEDNFAPFTDRNFNGLEDRFAICLNGIPLEQNGWNSHVKGWYVESWDLIELTSGVLSVQFQENQEGKWTTLDETPLQWEIVESDADTYDGQIPQSSVDEMCLVPEESSTDITYPPHTFVIHLQEYNCHLNYFGGNYSLGIHIVGVQFGTKGWWAGCRTPTMDCPPLFYLPTHTNLPNPMFMQEANRYDINALNQQVDLLWEYINALEKCATDVNRDTVVDVNDLLEVVADWGNICETPKGK